MNALEAVRAGILKLLPERAVWAPGARTLFVADLHLGKAAAFRAFGAPAPTGVSEETLRRLAGLIDAIGPQHVVALGDFTHARAAMTPGLLKSLCDWRTRWSSLAFTIVLGNHDRGAERFYADCGFACADAPVLLADIECRHHPLARDNVSGPLALAGHLHPVVRLNGPGRDSLRTPCFVVGKRQIVLPAFGEFVGGSLATPGDGERALIATARGVFDVTPGAVGAPGRLSTSRREKTP
ncbi:MAG: ligase-associated DNA damage response endonuclease PdeM [Roseiarcus sp.]